VLFTKNIILPTLAGLVFLTFANIYYAGARNALGNIAKIIAVLTILTIGFLGTDRLIDGALSTRISEEFWGHILKTNSLDSVILDDVVSGRTRIYEIVWPRFFQSPIFGNGYGQTIHYSELGVDSNENIPLHNAFLDQLISVGLFGLLLLLLPLLLWYIHCSTKAFYAASNKMSIAILTFVIALSVYSLGNSVKYFYGITCFAVCIMSLYYGQALQYAAQQNRDRNQPVRHTPISHS
jgi:O-antigen ligase